MEPPTATAEDRLFADKAHEYAHSFFIGQPDQDVAQIEAIAGLAAKFRADAELTGYMRRLNQEC